MVAHEGTHEPQTGEAREKIVKTWGPIAAKEWTSTWHHIALTLRFAHTVRGAELEPEVDVLASALHRVSIVADVYIL